MNVPSIIGRSDGDCRPLTLRAEITVCFEFEKRNMALITITGYPSSGKTRRATQLKDHLEKRLQDPGYTGPKLKVQIISDDELNLDRNVYNGVFHWIVLSITGSKSTWLTKNGQTAAPKSPLAVPYSQPCSGRWAKIHCLLSTLWITSKAFGTRCIVLREN